MAPLTQRDYDRLGAKAVRKAQAELRARHADEYWELVDRFRVELGLPRAHTGQSNHRSRSQLQLMEMNGRFFILAGHRAIATKWCKENSISPHGKHVVYVSGDTRANHLEGLRATPADKVVLLEGWRKTRNRNRAMEALERVFGKHWDDIEEEAIRG